MLSGMPAPGKGPESPFQHYLQMAEHDIRRKKLHRPAEYLTGRDRIPLHGVLRARCQASGGLRGEREDPLSPRPYQARHCTRFDPQTPNQLFYYTHLTVDNTQHVTTECISTQLPRNKLTAKMNNVMLDYGMTERWIDLTPIERTALAMGSTGGGRSLVRIRPNTDHYLYNFLQVGHCLERFETVFSRGVVGTP